MPDPELPQRSPYVIKCGPGTYAWCSCGKSAKQPFCDGSHGGTTFLPRVEKLDEEKMIAWCGCKRSASPPFCDGTHSRIPD